MAKETGRLRGHPSRRAVGRDKQGFGRATPVRLLFSWEEYRMAALGRDCGSVGDSCAFGKECVSAGFYVFCRQSHSNRRRSSWADGCLLGKSAPCRRKPSGKDIVACDRPAVSEEGGKALAEERKELLAEREKTIPEDSHGNSGKPYPDGIGRYPGSVPNVGKVKKERSHWLAVSLFASNTPGKSIMNYGNGGVVLMGTIPSWGHPEAMECGKFPVTAIRSAHRYVDGVVPMKHKQPVRFGVSACYAVNERFGIESGLSYTYLSSSLSSSGEDYSYEVRQSLQYVGIPLNFKASLWKKRWMDLYLSAGGMAEKCVDGDTETDYTWKGRIKSSTHKDVREKPWQYSVNAAAGMQLNLSSVVGLYVEPGVSYYFDNGSSVSNIYKEKPLNFNLEFGLRFSFGL